MDVIRKTLAVMAKDLRVIAQDRAYVISMFIFPVLIALLNSMSSGGSQGIQLPVVLVNQDSGGYGAAILNVLEQIPELDSQRMEAPDQAEQQVASGGPLAAVIIPAEFSQRIDDYQAAEITVILDPAQVEYGRIITSILDEISASLAIQGEIRYGIRQVLADSGLDSAANPELARAAQAQVEGVIFTQLAQMETDAPIQVERQVIKGKQVFSWDNIAVLMLPALTVMFAFFITAAMSTDLIKEREAGSLRRLVAAPLPRGALIGGKVLAYTLVVVIQVAIIFLIGALAMDMSFGNSPFGLILITLSLGLVATTLGMLVASLAKSVEQAGSISLVLIFVLGFLSGSFAPQTAFYRGEGFMALLSRLTPQAQATIGYHTILLQGGGVVDILPQVVYLLGLSLVFFLIAIWRFRFEG
jgi:ABC-2 type transport system permease protein